MRRATRAAPRPSTRPFALAAIADRRRVSARSRATPAAAAATRSAGSPPPASTTAPAPCKRANRAALRGHDRQAHGRHAERARFVEGHAAGDDGHIAFAQRARESSGGRQPARVAKRLPRAARESRSDQRCPPEDRPHEVASARCWATPLHVRAAAERDEHARRSRRRQLAWPRLRLGNLPVEQIEARALQNRRLRCPALSAPMLAQTTRSARVRAAAVVDADGADAGAPGAGNPLMTAIADSDRRRRERPLR